MNIDRMADDHLPGARVGIVAARFNSLVVKKLVDGATDALEEHGIAHDDVALVWVPGCFELPIVATRLAPKVDVVVCLGAVIRGETPHFDLVARAAADGIREAAVISGKPVIFGVLTTDTLDQALDRAGGAHGNKGWDAAEAALEMVSVVAALEEAG